MDTLRILIVIVFTGLTSMSDLEQAHGNTPGPTGVTFVNSLGMTMIGVQGASFDA